MFDPKARTLEGKKGLIIGIANDKSIAYGCSKAFKFLGADDLAVTYLNDKAKPYVQPLAEEVGAGIFMPLDAQIDGQMEAVFEEIERNWGRLDFALHSIAFAPKEDLHGRLVDCSCDGFLSAMDVSCHSFIRMTRLAEPLMTNGGALFTMSYCGADKVIENYNVMGPVKSALESARATWPGSSAARGSACTPSLQALSRHAQHPGSRTSTSSSIAPPPPHRTVKVGIAIEGEDGELHSYEGYRVQHNLARGPMKGGLRYHPAMDEDHATALAS